MFEGSISMAASGQSSTPVRVAVEGMVAETVVVVGRTGSAMAQAIIDDANRSDPIGLHLVPSMNPLR